jgi:hypothetical protein
MPPEWDDAAQIQVSPSAALERVAQSGDGFADLIWTRQSLAVQGG